MTAATKSLIRKTITTIALDEAIRQQSIPNAISPKPTDKDRDKYQHVLTYSDETITKHSYLNIDGVSDQPVTSQHVTLLHITTYKFTIGNINYPVQNRLDNLLWL